MAPTLFRSALINGGFKPPTLRFDFCLTGPAFRWQTQPRAAYAGATSQLQAGGNGDEYERLRHSARATTRMEHSTWENRHAQVADRADWRECDGVRRSSAGWH